MSLFLFDKKNNLVLHPDALKLTSHLKNLTGAQLHYIILAYDYSSKFHQWPEEERKRKASREVFPGVPIDEIEGPILQQIEEYRELQYDPMRETMNTYVTKKAMLEADLMKESNVRKITELDKAIEMLEKRIINIQKELDKKAEDKVLKGKRKQSFIEKWQENQVLRRKEQQAMAGYQTGTEYIS